MGNAGSASAAAGSIERMRSAAVTRRTGAFGKRTRKMTRTWEVINTKNAYTMRRPNSDRAALAGLPAVTAMPIAATPAERPPAPSPQGRPEEEPEFVREQGEGPIHGLPSPEPAPPAGALDGRRGGLLGEPEEDVFEASFLSRVSRGPQGREVSRRDVPPVVHDCDAPA